MNGRLTDEKDEIRWALHWPKDEVPTEKLAPYPDLQFVDRQIKSVSDALTLRGTIATIYGVSFDIRDFPMDDRIAQREFVRVVGINVPGIKDVKIGRNPWEVFHASEIVVIGIFKRLREVLDIDYNPYKMLEYVLLDDGDIAIYDSKQVVVSRHYGAHLMKYYREGEEWKPIFTTRFRGRVPKEKPLFAFNDGQLEMVF